MTPDLPEGIITRFRTLSLERLGRVEATWNSLIGGVQDHNALREVARDLHTLKGDSRMVGFDDVHVLSQKLEELFAVAGQLDYRVSDDLELVITMAIQFLGVLLRKKSGNAVSGIDLPGFVRQVDEVLRETRAVPTIAMPRTATIGKVRVPNVKVSMDRLSEPTRHRLAVAATNAYLEYLSARGTTSRTRLRGVWATLRDELSGMQSVPLEPVIDRHATTAQSLARELGKQVAVELELGAMRVESRVAEALDLAIVHLIRNALDHGIEPPPARVAAGKPAYGMIRIRAAEQLGMTVLEIEDDGAGIDLDAVRERAIERGLLRPERAATASDAELLDYIFHPGFTTRSMITEVSGRGVGMDAVKAALVRVGGNVSISTTKGHGSKVTLETPAPIRQIRAYQFLSPGGGVSLAVSARWTPVVEDGPARDALDPATAIQLAGSSRQTVLDLARPVRDLVLRLRWGFLEIALRAATEPVLVTADRICPTPDDYPLEVVAIDQQETILLRPEHLTSLVERTA